VSPLDLNTVVVLPISDSPEHAIVDGLAFEQNGRQAVAQGNHVGAVRLSIFADLLDPIQRPATVSGRVETGRFAASSPSWMAA
jgi:hypothetical protein